MSAPAVSHDHSSPAADTPSVAISFLLSVIAGTVDVTTFVLLGGVFSAHITGNLVLLLADLANGQPLNPVSASSILLFILVTALLAALVDRSRTGARVWITPIVSGQLVLLTTAGVLAVISEPAAGSIPAAGVVLLAVAAMAAQNALLHLTLTRAPTTAVMTGNIVAAVAALVGLLLRGRSDHRDRRAWQSTWPLVAGFALGGLGAAICCNTIGEWSWSIPVVLSGLLLLVTVHRSAGRPTSAG